MLQLQQASEKNLISRELFNTFIGHLNRFNKTLSSKNISSMQVTRWFTISFA